MRKGPVRGSNLPVDNIQIPHNWKPEIALEKPARDHLATLWKQCGKPTPILLNRKGFDR